MKAVVFVEENSFKHPTDKEALEKIGFAVVELKEGAKAPVTLYVPNSS